MSSLEAKNCVVLGAGGFIGTNLCKKLVLEARSVRAFGRGAGFSQRIDGVEWINGDFQDSQSVTNAIKGADVVFHLINSKTPQSANADIVGDVSSNVVPTLRLLDGCCASGVSKVVYVSSGGTVYGVPGRLPTPETETCWPKTAYGISKLSIERYLHLYNSLYALDYQILRVSNPYGPHQVSTRQQGVIAAFLAKIFSHEPVEIWGDGEIRRDYIFVSDVVDALTLAAKSQNKLHRLFNVGSGKSLSLNELVAKLEIHLNQKIVINFRPGRPVDIPTSFLDISLAKRELDWSPKIGLDEGIRQTIAWFRSVGSVGR